MPRSRKPTPDRCPRCGEQAVVPIVYGLPTPDTMDRAAAGTVVVGGCVVGPQEWACLRCSYEWPLPSEMLSQEPVAAALSFLHSAYANREDGSRDLNRALEAGQLLFDAGFDARLVAAGLLHDVLEHGDVCAGEIADAAGAPVATLVEALTQSPEIPDHDRRMLERRARVARAGSRAMAVFAAAALARLRSLRREYAVWGEELNRLLGASLDEQLVQAERDLRTIRRVDGDNPFASDLESEIDALRADRRSVRAARR